MFNIQDEKVKSFLSILLFLMLIFIIGVFYVTSKKNNAQEQIKDWSISTSTPVTFKYPIALSTTYISASDWPPQLQILNSVFTCTEGGSEIQRTGLTQAKKINGNNYCITTFSEGAAGSIYTLYAYAFPKDDKTFILTFTTRSTQCANYPDPQKTACENERNTFKIDNLIDQIVNTIQ